MEHAFNTGKTNSLYDGHHTADIQIVSKVDRVTDALSNQAGCVKKGFRVVSINSRQKTGQASNIIDNDVVIRVAQTHG